MRISDWSSDVCSSDLIGVVAAADGNGEIARRLIGRTERDAAAAIHRVEPAHRDTRQTVGGVERTHRHAGLVGCRAAAGDVVGTPRTEERRVGKEGGSTGRSRGAPYPSKKKQK